VFLAKNKLKELHSVALTLFALTWWKLVRTSLIMKWN